MFVLKNDRSNLFYSFTGGNAHVQKRDASRFHTLQAAQNCAKILTDGAGRGVYTPEAA